jgi:thymidylate synthase (FAD)
MKIETGRPTNDGAEKWLGERIGVLDQFGYVMLVDYMGSDQEIERAARVSYKEGTKTVTGTGGLIRTLMRDQHTSPFEMVEFKFQAKMPIFVARQWVRHRTASLNEVSGRYSVLPDEFYIPSREVIGEQSMVNRQGRGETIEIGLAEKVRRLLTDDSVNSHSHYREMIDDNVAREIARMGLSLNHYTEWVWKIDLHNLLHFLKLRMDVHAQLEIREYANAMAKVVADAVPLTWKAFEDYELSAMRLSKLEVEAIASTVVALGNVDKGALAAAAGLAGISSKTELAELERKMKKLGLLR